jgi:hypothetical protein
MDASNARTARNPTPASTRRVFEQTFTRRGATLALKRPVLPFNVGCGFYGYSGMGPYRGG